jgi:hypothetical protein
MPRVATDIGPIGQLEGRVIGLNAVANLVTDLGPLAAQHFLRKRPGKNHNDQAVPFTVGSDKGRPIKDVSWMPSLSKTSPWMPSL